MKNFIKSALTVLISVLVMTAFVKAGTITPPSGAPTAQFYTLSEIYNLISSNATTTAGSHDFTFSDALAGSGKTLTQIYDALTGLVSADKIKLGTTYLSVAGTLVPSGGDAATSSVCSGKTFFGDGQANWTLQTGSLSIDASKILSGTSYCGTAGTISDIGQQIITASTSNLTITQGYHDGTGYCLGDSDLISSNIKSGVNLFGVDGDGNVVDTSSGNATAGDIFSGKIAWVNGTSTAGTMADNGSFSLVASSSDQSVTAGYYSGGILSGDGDLTASNIKSGVTIFGVDGSYTAAGGLPDENQTTCYNDSASCICGEAACTGGNAWPNQSAQNGEDGNREDDLTVGGCGTGTVLDSLTNLCWQQDASTTGKTWKAALQYCDSLNLGDYTDWRLPKAIELLTIVDWGYENSSYWHATKFTNYNTDNYYWSATTRPDSITSAYYLRFSYGYLGGASKTGTYYAVCVREN